MEKGTLGTLAMASLLALAGPAFAADKNPFGLVYANAITENVPGQVQIHHVHYDLNGINIAANVYTPADYKIETISPRPMLFIMGEKAHSQPFTKDAYAKTAEPKELIIVPGADHFDLYDKLEYLPIDKLAEFFHVNLKKSESQN